MKPIEADETPIEIKGISFCDEVSEGQFGKVNLIGLNAGEFIAINESPYSFDSMIFIEGALLHGEKELRLDISLTMLDQLGQKVGDAICSAPIANPNGERRPFIFFKRVRVQIILGSMRVEIACQGRLIFSTTFHIQAGESPNIHVNGESPTSGLLGPGTDFDLETILRSATKELIIIDPFLSAKEAIDMFTVVPKATTIRILASKKAGSNMKNAGGNVSKIEMRFSDFFHDRFIIVNGSEYFHFGHSFKGIHGTKASRYQKMYKKEEIDRLNELFQSTWNQADASSASPPAAPPR